MKLTPNNNIVFQETSSTEKQYYNRLFSQKRVIIITMNKGHLYVDHYSPEAVKHSGLCGSSCLAVFHCDSEINKNEDGGTDHSVWTHPLHLAGC